jgi:hypothetical protein
VLNLFRPEGDSIRDPSFGTRAYAQAKAVTHTGVLPVHHLGPKSAQPRNPLLHGRWRGDAVPVTHGNERRGSVDPRSE